MKNLFLAFLLIVSCKLQAQILFAGNHVFEAYLGIPNTARFSGGLNFMTGEINDGEITKFRGLAPSGIRYTYMISEDISFGFDMIYNYSNVSRATTDTLYNGITGQWEYQQTSTQDITKRLRFHARLNFHLLTSSPQSDSYIGIGAGTNNRWITSIKDGEVKTFKGSDASILPISMRICYGYRYYFGYNWGITGEVGLGGPLVSFGVSYKM
jgi:hypothetical protein